MYRSALYGNFTVDCNEIHWFPTDFCTTQCCFFILLALYKENINTVIK